MAGNLERVFEKWQSGLSDPDEFIWLQSTKNTVEMLFRGADVTISFPPDVSDIKQFTISNRKNDQWIQNVTNKLQNDPSIVTFTDLLDMLLKQYDNKDSVEEPLKKAKHSNEDDNSDEAGGNDEDDDEAQDTMTDDHQQDEEGGEEDYDDDNEQEDDLEEDDAFENDDFQEALQTLKMKKIWAKKDQEIRAKLGEKKLSSNVKTIFSSDAAFGVLTNDLFSIMQNVHSLGFSATPIDDNIYFWSVKIFGFDPSSKIYGQLQQIKKEFDYDYIEIQVLFTEDLYPFYPPTLKVVRPRLQGFLLGRVSHLEILKLDNWNPICDMRFVLNHLKDVITKYGSLDVNNPTNSLTSTGSYSSLEHFLLRLEVLSDTPPRANLKYGLESSMFKPAAIKTTTTTTTTTTGGDQKTCWAKGTGYGRSADKSGWNVDAFLAAQKERDSEIRSLILAIEQEIRDHNPPFDVLEESCLLPFIESYCRDISLLDIERHSELWTSLFNLIFSLLDKDIYIGLFSLLQFQTRSLSDYINDCEKQIKLFLSRIEDNKNLTLLNFIVSTNKKMNEKLKQFKDEIELLESNRGQLTSDSKDEDGNDEKKYIEKLKPLVFDSADLKVQKGKGSIQSRTIRIAQEQSSMMKALPLTFDSSIFVRIDEKSIDVMQCLITGPKDTPYSGGCFLFNCTFPAEYPAGPPHVVILTTGGGSVRFNPNLYNNGKVCLSLLGTWSGGAGETWNPNTSTLLQVFISIQSLILVPEPFFNEPGYENQMGTKSGTQSSMAYNHNLIPSTIQFAMIDMIQNPPEPFKDVIRAHFYYQKQKIMKQCDAWIEEFKEQKKDYAKILKLVNQLGDLLKNLKEPGK